MLIWTTLGTLEVIEALRDWTVVPVPSDRWNHNTLYHPVVLGSIPDVCNRALDVGCGVGMLTRELRQVVPEVVGIDTDESSIAAARADLGASDVDYVQATS